MRMRCSFLLELVELCDVGRPAESEAFLAVAFSGTGDHAVMGGEGPQFVSLVQAHASSYLVDLEWDRGNEMETFCATWALSVWERPVPSNEAGHS